MFTILKKLPMDCYVAFSGGKDSTVFTKYLLANPNRKVTLLHYNHGLVEEDFNSHSFALDFAKENNLNIIVGINNETPTKYNKGYENHCRELRYSFLNKFDDKPIIMCHHLGDVLESWVFSGWIHANPKLIPYKRNIIIRPFLAVSTKQVSDYAEYHNIIWYEDKTNTDLTIVRNRIRHNIIPEMRSINLGLETKLKKLVIKKYNN